MWSKSGSSTVPALDPWCAANFGLKKCGFSMGRDQYWTGRAYGLCVYYMTGTPEGSTKSGFIFFVAFLGINQFHRFGLI